MKAITATIAVVVCGVLVMAGCSGHASFHRVVTGRLLRVGGPAPGAPVPLPGRIEARDAAGNVWTAAAGRSGRFRLSLPPGTYRLTGRSPLIGKGTMLCSAARPLHVTKVLDVSADVEVICSIK